MKNNIIKIFVVSAGALLFLTAAAKIISACGSVRVLQAPEPIFLLSYRGLLWILGIAELITAMFCFLSKNRVLQCGLIAWLSTNFIIYRVAFFLAGFKKPCPCLGNITDTLNISSQTAELFLKATLFYLFFGSVTALFWIWRETRRASTHCSLG